MEFSTYNNFRSIFRQIFLSTPEEDLPWNILWIFEIPPAIPVALVLKEGVDYDLLEGTNSSVIRVLPYD